MEQCLDDLIDGRSRIAALGEQPCRRLEHALPDLSLLTRTIV
jgi:hypothetical protein